MNSTNAISGVNYVKLNATLAQYFENSKLVEKAKTQAIVVIYKVCSPSWESYTYSTISATSRAVGGRRSCWAPHVWQYLLVRSNFWCSRVQCNRLRVLLERSACLISLALPPYDAGAA